jgi:hypothetical protein
MLERIYHFNYRLYPPGDPGYDRCVGMSWCSICREVSEYVGSVDPGKELWDPLAELPAHERERLGTHSGRIRDYLDRLVRRGAWPRTKSRVQAVHAAVQFSFDPFLRIVLLPAAAKPVQHRRVGQPDDALAQR